jgi:Mg-chelatase subunit ChlD
VMVYALIISILLLVVTSLAVDYGIVQLAKTELRAAVDAAALAGSSGVTVSPAEARARAKAVAGLNSIAGQRLVLLDSDIELGTWNNTTRTFTLLTGVNEDLATAVRVNGQLTTARGSPIKLPFTGTVMPMKTKELNTSAIGASAVDSADIVVVQDVSGSFAAEIDYARAGDEALFNSLNVPGSSSRFGLVAFTGQATTVTPMQSVRSTLSTLLGAIGNLSVGGLLMPSTDSGTDIAAGLEQGLDVFESVSKNDNNRAIVLVSDGEPSASSLGAHPTLNASQLLELAREKADEAWADGISVYVVFWDEANSPIAADNLRSLVRGRGKFVHVTDPAELPTAIAMVMRAEVRIVR